MQRLCLGWGVVCGVVGSAWVVNLFLPAFYARVAEVVWNRLPERVRVLYVKCVCLGVRGVPE